MRLSMELGWVVLGLVALNLAMAFGAIGLFMRMGPAIEGILQKNDATIAAAEEILVAFAETSREVLDEGRVDQVRLALERAKSNVTEEEEPEVLRAIENELEGAFGGDPVARESLVRKVTELIEINRAAMHRVDLQARRLGESGAWAAVVVGLVTVGLSLLIASRLERRVVRPLADVRQVLQAALAGDGFRRCGKHRAAKEVQDVLHAVNELLDARRDLFRPGSKSHHMTG